MYTYQTTDGQEITISTRTYTKDTRTGFSHYCELRIVNETTNEGFEIIAKCVYYNRTWEEYRYQSVTQVAVQKAMKSTKNAALLDALKNYYETL